MRTLTHAKAISKTLITAHVSVSNVLHWFCQALCVFHIHCVRMCRHCLPGSERGNHLTCSFFLFARVVGRLNASPPTPCFAGTPWRREKRKSSNYSKASPNPPQRKKGVHVQVCRLTAVVTGSSFTDRRERRDATVAQLGAKHCVAEAQLEKGTV